MNITVLGKLLGAACIVASGTAAGAMACRELKCRIRTVQAMDDALARLGAQIELLTPTKNIVDELAASREPSAARFFTVVSEGLDRDEPVSKTWEAACSTLGWDDAAFAAAPVGNLLGRCDAAALSESISSARERLSECERRAEANYEQKGRLYRRLGTAVGAAVAVIFI